MDVWCTRQQGKITIEIDNTLQFTKVSEKDRCFTNKTDIDLTTHNLNSSLKVIMGSLVHQVVW